MYMNWFGHYMFSINTSLYSVYGIRFGREINSNTFTTPPPPSIISKLDEENREKREPRG